jgi:DNA-binding transcriptional LysR family regulator
VRFTGLTPGREWSFDDQGAETKVGIESAFSANSAETTILAAEQGMGLVMVLGYQVAAQLAAGSLVRVLRDFEPEPLPVQAVYATGRLLPAKVRAFIDLLAQEIPATLASLQPTSASAVRRRDGVRTRKPKGRTGRR